MATGGARGRGADIWNRGGGGRKAVIVFYQGLKSAEAIGSGAVNCSVKNMKIKTNCSYSKMIKVSDLKPNPMNPNVHPKNQIELLAEVLKYTGWRDPITISNLSGCIVRGHGRMLAAKLLGCETVPVDYQDYENDQMELADLVADNVIKELSRIDDNLIKSIMAKMKDESLIVMTGFCNDEILKIMGGGEPEVDEHFDYYGSFNNGGDPEEGNASIPGAERQVKEIKFYKLPLLFSESDRDLIVSMVEKYQQDNKANTPAEALILMCKEWESA